MNITRFVVALNALLLSLAFVGFCWSKPPASAAQADSKTAAELVAQGVELDRRGEHDKSLALYTEAIRLDGSHVNAYFRRGLLHLTTGQLEKSLEDSKKVIHLEPQWGYGYWLRGAAYGASGKLDQAFTDYEEAIRLDPELGQAYFGRGLVHQSRGDLQAALRDFDEAVRLVPQDTNMQRRRAQLRFELGLGTEREIDDQLINVSNNAGRSIYPVVVVGQEDDIHLVWMDSTPGNFDIFYSKWNGENWTSPANLSNNPTLSMYPTVSMDLEGQVHVTWMDGDPDGDLHVLHSQLVESNWSEPYNVSRAKGISQRPQIAVDSSGLAHIVWFGNQGGAFELYHAQLVHSQWTEPSNTDLVEWYITHDPKWSRNPSLSAGPDGSIHLAWVGLEDVPSPYSLTQNIRHSRWANNTWSKPDIVSKYGDMRADLETPGLVVDQTGMVHVVWEDRGSVWYASFDGHEWSDRKQLNLPGLKSAMATVSYSAMGSLHFAWLGVTDGKPQVYYRQLSEGQWSDCANVSASPGSALGCTLAMDRSDQLHMVWMDDETGEFDIVHRRPMPED